MIAMDKVEVEVKGEVEELGANGFNEFVEFKVNLVKCCEHFRRFLEVFDAAAVQIMTFGLEQAAFGHYVESLFIKGSVSTEALGDVS